MRGAGSIESDGEPATTVANEETKDPAAKKAEGEKADTTKGKWSEFLKGAPEYDKDVSATIEIVFPIEFKKLLLLQIIEGVLERILVRNTPGIERCTLIPPSKPSDEPHIIVEGINFMAFERHPDKFDLRRLQTNHSCELRNRYGIEACRNNIVKEIRGVFAVYGIDVDFRHLSLIADFITYNGDYRAFNRIGMENSSSPFLKMSFETTMKYLVASAS